MASTKLNKEYKFLKAKLHIRLNWPLFSLFESNKRIESHCKVSECDCVRVEKMKEIKKKGRKKKKIRIIKKEKYKEKKMEKEKKD